MKFPEWLPTYGDTTFRGKCPLESLEQVSVFNRLRREYPDDWGVLAFHPRNEQLLSGGQFAAMVKHKAEGMTPGVVDLIIPARVPLVMEIKRRDHTLSKWQPGQLPYLEAAQNAGAFACVALGALGAWEAFEAWRRQQV